MIRYEIDDKRNVLVILASNEGRSEIARCFRDGGYDYAEGFVGDAIVGDGLSFIPAEDIGALTSAPIIGEIEYDDHGVIAHVGKVFWFPDYMVLDPWQILAHRGRVEFSGGQ